MSLIEIRGLTKQFDPKRPPALNQITSQIPQGKIVGIVGPDGAGKTTFIRILAALLLPSSGTVFIDGLDTTTDKEKLHEIIGYMPQQFGLYEDLTVLENMNLYADLQGLPKEKIKLEFERLFSFSGLAPFKDRLAKNLSGGMKQKLGLIATLMRKPKLLLLDEPTVGVDPLSRRELWKMVSSLQQEGISVIWSTSYLDEAEKCAEVLLLDQGKLLYQGDPKTFGQTGSSFEDAYIDRLGGNPMKQSPFSDLKPLEKDPNQWSIEASGLTKKFGNFVAVNHVDFKVKPGEIFGLLGPNGAGKSTTFKMLCGLLQPTLGQCQVEGISFQSASSQARGRIGYMSQKFSLYGNMTVLQNLQFFSGIYPVEKNRVKEMIDKMVAIFDFKPYLNTPSATLPIGFQRRLSLACAIMHEPAVLFLDEPTSGVDPVTRREFWSHINALVQKGITVMVTTHFMDEAELCDRLALMNNGQIMMTGTPVELKQKAASETCPYPTLEDAFIILSGEK
jgi:ABC-type multidrug transport system ATPase subunit